MTDKKNKKNKKSASVTLEGMGPGYSTVPVKNDEIDVSLNKTLPADSDEFNLHKITSNLANNMDTGKTLPATTSGDRAFAKTMVADDVTTSSRNSPERLQSVSDTIISSRLLKNLTMEHQGRYEVLREIGRGGIGKVMLALDHHVGRNVAVKELLPNPVSGSSVSSSRTMPSQAEIRFLNEARITGTLEHPGIVPVYELGQREDGTVYYVMKLVQGTTMSSRLEGADLNERLKLLSSFLDLCNAIAFAHSKGVIHRDLKPENVMLGKFGETIVLDWGLAKTREGEDFARGELAGEIADIRKSMGLETVSGQPVGTPPYMPPEQAMGDVEAIDERTDVYTLGAILYEILTGQPPHTGSNPMAVLLSVISEEIPAPDTIEAAVPGELAAIAMRALEKDKRKRYGSALELAEEVRNFQEGRIVRSYNYSGTELLKRWFDKHRKSIYIGLSVLCVAIGMWWYRGFMENRRYLAREKERISDLNKQLDDLFLTVNKPEGRREKWLDVYSYKLISLKEPVVEKKLIKLLDSESKDVRKLAARALGGMKSRMSVNKLISKIAPGGEKEEDVIIEIINALGIIGDKSAHIPVRDARWRFHQYSVVWNQTELAFKMIPIPEDVIKNKENADELFKNGRSWENKGNREKAIFYYEKALMADPKFVKALNSLGTICKNRMQYEKALQYFSKAIEIKPDYFAPYNNRSLVYSGMEKYDDALRDLDRAIQLKPDNTTLINNRAWVYRMLGETSKAAVEYERLIKKAPDNRKYLFNYGRLLLENGRLDDSEKVFRKVLASDSQYVQAWLELAKISYIRKLYADALVHVEKAWELDPKNADVTAWKVRIFKVNENSEQFNKFIKLLEKENTDTFQYLFKLIIDDFSVGKYPFVLSSLNNIFEKTKDQHMKYILSLHMLSVGLRAGKTWNWQSNIISVQPSDAGKWIPAIIKFLKGEIDERKFVSRARCAREKNDMNYYIGLKAELTGDFSRAATYYKKVVNSVFIEEFEYLFAERGLEILQGTKK
ncbi:protein kinase [Myxococcota bacterium]|nr:protein kinase [Myxococcota bacterium]MBU1381816.1 protein kinase [Myxococcota bacterium]MBU1498593.1 protein kinase [Myxococcota bacterium]